jgi:integrase/recombinase XerD
VEVQAFPVRLPSGATYWTVLDDDLQVVPEADAFLHQLRFGGDAAESTTEGYARALALYFRWCARTGQSWVAADRLGSFITWLKHTPANPDRPVRTGPGARPVRREGRVNFVLTAVRGFLRHGVEAGTVPPQVLSQLYQISDDSHLPPEVRGEGGRR